MSSEKVLGVHDTGIFSDLDGQVQLRLPELLDPQAVRAVIDRGHSMLVLYLDGWPIKVYPLTGDAHLSIGTFDLTLRSGDRTELAPLLTKDRVRELDSREMPAPGDADRDGIPDPLDLLIGGKKAVINADSYGAGYIAIPFPGGDVPRKVGVCTDVVIRATRNAGLDLQVEVNRDIKRSRRTYPMVKRVNANIDHRRVKTLLPYFHRHWEKHTPALEDPDDPLRPGDVVFMDTFPSWPGPDHIGIISDRQGASGHPLVINNWTVGFHTAELDLLGWVPVTDRFRYPSSAH
jgi:uncharacterized protein YijF (DUF1287 family)